MTAPWAAALATTGLAAVGAIAWFAAERAEQKARAALVGECGCGACFVARLHRMPSHTCPICKAQQTPKPGASCATCLIKFRKQLDEWGVTR